MSMYNETVTTTWLSLLYYVLHVCLLRKYFYYRNVSVTSWAFITLYNLYTSAKDKTITNCFFFFFFFTFFFPSYFDWSWLNIHIRSLFINTYHTIGAYSLTSSLSCRSHHVSLNVISTSYWPFIPLCYFTYVLFCSLNMYTNVTWEIWK